VTIDSRPAADGCSVSVPLGPPTSYGRGVSQNDRVEIVRFSGGEHDGLVVEAPAHVAERLHAMRFEVLATGRLYDLTEERRIPGARAITPPEPRAIPAPRPPAIPSPAPPVDPAVDPAVDLAATAVLEPPAPVEAPRFADAEPPAPRRPVLPPPSMPLFRSGRPAD
jgi:hypothetical protein